MYKKSLIILPLLIILILSGFLTSLPTSDVNAQIIITLQPIATATRTPTPINIGNFVWDDLDKDGRQDPGEPGLSGVTVQLWNSAKTQLIDSTTTNGSGIYTLVAPFPGNYRVRVVLPNIPDSFSPKDNAAAGDLADSDINPDGTNFGFTDIFNIASNVISMTHIDAGIIIYRAPTATRTQTPINLGNFVWDDLDHDGRQDVGEPGLAGVTVQLWNSAKSQMLASTTTNGSGIYTLIAQTPGDYLIRVVLPSMNDSFSPKDQAAGDDTLDSDINPDGANLGFTDIFNIASNVISRTNLDAGIIKYRTPTPTRTQTPINIGNFVWHDLDKDGIQDVGEPGVAGVTVQLWNSAKSQLIHTTTTNGSGIYNLVAPLPGDYRVRVIPFPGSAFTAIDQGADDTLDSDIINNIISKNYGFTDIFNLASNVISINKIDAGLSTVGATSTPNPLATQTPTPTKSPTLQVSGTPMPDLSQKIYLPLVTNN
ncbi:MAG: SdrD B-like domain-containing protein [Anaerolineaceae bacterium]|nr:SdrD B-like domain-containing protein [Anaerolineaceae bacterium]